MSAGRSLEDDRERGESPVKRYGFALAVLFFAHAAFADIAVTDKGSTLRYIGKQQAVDKAAIKAANAAKRAAKRARHSHSGWKVVDQSFHLAANATGSVQLIDAGGLKYFINTNITFSTSSSASGAASEASFTAPIAASTLAGGSVMQTLSDMFDGYGALCVSLTNS